MEATIAGGDVPSASSKVAPREHDPGVAPGAVVGRYVVVSRVGAGGMGVVFAAYDPELDRKVAIKVLLHGETPATRDALATSVAFREAQALGKLSHPNVVAVHDVGTTARGRVWLAMEFVEGRTLTQWLRARPRSWREVLEVLRSAGAGLAAAHAAGLVHHDIKPDNVMIDEDDRGRVTRVRVMDFGLAHHDDASVRASSSRARPSPANASPLGTPAYMAPEQWSREATDARTDQFSFCAMAWEAMHGQRPFAGDSAAAIASAVLAGDVRPPPARPRVPRWLRQILRRGLEVERSRRHASMVALLDAIDRGRVGARRRFAATAVLGALAIVGGGLGVRAWQRADRAARCADEGAAIRAVWNADVEADVRASFLRADATAGPATAERVTPWLTVQADAWAEVATAVCVANRIEGALDDELYDRAQWCLDESRAELEDTVAQFMSGSARARRTAARTAASLGSVDACAEPRVLARTPAPTDDQRDEVVAVRTMLSEVRSRSAALDRDGALAIGDEAVARAMALGWAPLTAKVQLRRAALLEELGRFAEAEEQAVEAYFTAMRGSADGNAFAAADWLAFIIGVRQGRPVEGMRWARQAELLLPPDEPRTTRRADALSTRGNLEMQLGRAAEAAALHREAFALREEIVGPDHPNTASSLNNLANAVYLTRDFAQATALYEDACKRLEDALGPASPDVGACLVNLASVVSPTDRARAIDVYTRAIANIEVALGEDHPNVASARTNLGVALGADGQAAAGRAELERALAIYERTLGPQHPQTAAPLEALALAAYGAGDHADAIAFGERLLALLERTRPEGTRQGELLLARFTLARSRAAAGGDTAAVREAAAALRAWFDSEEGRADPRRELNAADVDGWLASPGH